MDSGYISKLTRISDFSKSAKVLLNMICLLFLYFKAYNSASTNCPYDFPPPAAPNLRIKFQKHYY